MSGEERYDSFMDDWKGWEVNQGSVGEMLGGIDRRKGCNEECGGGTVHQLVATVVHNRTAKATGEWEKKKGDRNTWSLLPYQTEWKQQPGVGDRF